MNIIIAIVLAIFAWFLFVVIFTNIIGMIIRGFYERDERGSLRMTGGDGLSIVFSILLVITLYLLAIYVNIWAAIAAVLFTLGRIPDLLFELKTGVKVSKTHMPKGLIYTITGFLDWAAYPILVICIYQLIG